MNNNWHKKEKPLLGLTGLGGGVDGLAVVGAATKTYIDDVFSTYIYDGDGNSSHPITNNIDLSSNGGMTWIKRRDGTYDNWLMDSVRGGTKMLSSNSTAAEATNNAITSFNSDGFTLGDEGQTNAGGTNMASWTFRKTPGFFDIVTWTGNSDTNQTMSHSLGSVPGMIIAKRTDSSTTGNWVVYHREFGGYLRLNSSYAGVVDAGAWVPVDSTSFKAYDYINVDGASYVAYLFAGGESTAATATSVKTESTGFLGLAQSTDFNLGTSDFTIETWAKPLAGDRTGNNFYVLSMGYPFLLYYTADASVPYSGKFVWEGSSTNASMDYMASGNTGANSVAQNQWHHVAVTRSGSTFRFFLNGELKHTSTSSGTFGTNNTEVQIGRAGPVGTDHFQGQVSNFRYVLGTALYTDSFQVPTEPLSNVTNTKLLCCQGSATDSTTVSPGTITPYNSPSWSAESPFDDTEGLVFGGDSDKGIIKAGSYTGNAQSAGPTVNLGWEPSWILLKRAGGGAGSWAIFDNTRGIVTDGDDPVLQPDLNDAEYTTTQYLDVTSTGFKIKGNFNQSNASGDSYIYIAIRRPDGYVGKPASAGTEVFAMDAGAGSSTIPNFDSTFPVDFALAKTINSSSSWNIGARLVGATYASSNNSSAWSSAASFLWDSNVGWNTYSGWGSSSQSWMWKRGQGFDVINYIGTGTAGLSAIHSLATVPEMIWVKDRDNSRDWRVYHKDLNGGSNPEQWGIKLNSYNAESQNSSYWNDTAPTSTSFTVGTSNNTNNIGTNYIAMLFASVAGISKVGNFTPDSSGSFTVTLGFTPRFIVLRPRNFSDNNWGWWVYDSVRGFSSGTTNKLILESDAAQITGSTNGTTATGINFSTWGDMSAYNWIYYAHA